MSGHVSPKSMYYAIFGALMVLTAITVAVAFVNLGAFNFPVAISIAILKATLVVLFFMHVKYSSRLTKLIVSSAFFFLFILFALTMTDYLTRGMKSYDGGAAGAGYGIRSDAPSNDVPAGEPRESEPSSGEAGH